VCNRKRQQFKDYPCDTFTYAKQYDNECPTVGSGGVFTSGLFAPGSSRMLTFVSAPAGYLDENTLPVRWESPDVIASTPGGQWPHRLNVDNTGSHFGPKKSRNRAVRVDSETAKVQGQRRSNSFVVDVHSSNTSNDRRCHQIVVSESGRLGRSCPTNSHFRCA